MKKSIAIAALIAAIVLVSGMIIYCTEKEGDSSQMNEKKSMELTVHPKPTNEAFKNPMKGFRPTRFFHDTSFGSHEYGTVYKHYIRYTDLEVYAEDSVQKIKDWSNASWAGIEERNIKVVPRVVIEYPSAGEFWPEGVPHDDPMERWISDTFKTRLAAFIKKLGEAWDSDPRVAYVETGLWGKWGEHHVHPTVLKHGSDRIPLEMQRLIGDAFREAFPNKKVQVRYPKEFGDYEFGFFWDSFAHLNELASGDGIIARDHWRTQVNSGEVAYDWGDYEIQPGKNPNTSLSEAKHRNYIIDWIKKTHTSSLGWIDLYNVLNPEVAKGAEEMQKELGYRFVVQEASFSESVDPGEKLHVSFDVANVGSAPFYYDWPVEASLLREDRSFAWSARFDTDIREWMPGDDWDSDARTYQTAPTVHRVQGSFELPTDLEQGTYTLALSILDPAGNQPSIRFAIENYYKGGRHPIGKVGIGQPPSDQQLEPFDGLKYDNTLFYKLD